MHTVNNRSRTLMFLIPILLILLSVCADLTGISGSLFSDPFLGTAVCTLTASAAFLLWCFGITDRLPKPNAKHAAAMMGGIAIAGLLLAAAGAGLEQAGMAVPAVILSAVGEAMQAFLPALFAIAVFSSQNSGRSLTAVRILLLIFGVFAAAARLCSARLPAQFGVYAAESARLFVSAGLLIVVVLHCIFHQPGSKKCLFQLIPAAVLCFSAVLCLYGTLSPVCCAIAAFAAFLSISLGLETGCIPDGSLWEKLLKESVYPVALISADGNVEFESDRFETLSPAVIGNIAGNRLASVQPLNADLSVRAEVIDRGFVVSQLNMEAHNAMQKELQELNEIVSRCDMLIIREAELNADTEALEKKEAALLAPVDAALDVTKRIEALLTELQAEHLSPMLRRKQTALLKMQLQYLTLRNRLLNALTGDTISAAVLTSFLNELLVLFRNTGNTCGCHDISQGDIPAAGVVSLLDDLELIFEAAAAAHWTALELDIRNEDTGLRCLCTYQTQNRESSDVLQARLYATPFLHIRHLSGDERFSIFFNIPGGA